MIAHNILCSFSSLVSLAAEHEDPSGRNLKKCEAAALDLARPPAMLGA
jgi:hypothetical protein